MQHVNVMFCTEEYMFHMSPDMLMASYPAWNMKYMPIYIFIYRYIYIASLLLWTIKYHINTHSCIPYLRFRGVCMCRFYPRDSRC